MMRSLSYPLFQSSFSFLSIPYFFGEEELGVGRVDIEQMRVRPRARWKCGVNSSVFMRASFCRRHAFIYAKIDRLLCSALVELSVSEDPPILNQTGCLFWPIGAGCEIKTCALAHTFDINISNSCSLLAVWYVNGERACARAAKNFFWGIKKTQGEELPYVFFYKLLKHFFE